MSAQDKVVYELSVNVPGVAKGDGVQIAGLGTFENGSTNEVTRGQAEAYRSYHQRQVPVFGEEGEILGSELENGPTLLSAFKDSDMVTVVTVTGGSNNGGGDN